MIDECLVEAPYSQDFTLPNVWGFRQTDHRLYAIRGPFNSAVATGGGDAGFTMHTIGDDRESIETCEIRMRLARQDAGIFGVATVRESLTDVGVATPSFALTPDGKLEVDANGRLLSVSVVTQGQFESLGLLIDSTAQGAT